MKFVEYCMDFVINFIIICNHFYLLLNIRKFLNKDVSVCRYFSTNLVVKYLFGGKNIVIKCAFNLTFKKTGSI
jgi:hypothetical protein